MIGDVDPIKAARSGLQLGDELTMHYGLLPRANRGIFAINELPDLASKVQVGLFNILQEGDVQMRGYPVRLRLDVLLVFSANPEDYTARGKIITPLKDRIGSEIRTHYPQVPAGRDGDHRAGSLGGSPRQQCPADRGAAVRPRDRRGRSRSSRARRPESRQAVRRQPAAADHDARERRLERRAPRARARRVRRRPAGQRRLRVAAVADGQDRAGVRGRAEGRRGGRARAGPLGRRDGVRRLCDARRHAADHRAGSSAAARWTSRTA